MLKQCSHDNILRVLDLRCDEAVENLFVYLDLCRGGELFM